MFELILNVLLWLGLAYTYAFHVLEAPVPAKVLRNPYALKPDVWPSVIIILLLICVAINIIRIVTKYRGKAEFSLGAFSPPSADFSPAACFSASSSSWRPALCSNRSALWARAF